jgi:hypothetical protein
MTLENLLGVFSSESMCYSVKHLSPDETPHDSVAPIMLLLVLEVCPDYFLIARTLILIFKC